MLDGLRAHIRTRDHAKWNQFLNHLSQYNKEYETKEEYLRRFGYFKENLKTIKELQHNEMGTARYGLNEFADLSLAEFRRTRLSPQWTQPHHPPKQAIIEHSHHLPAAWDWRQHGKVTPVKNQGSCGSCWAFSVTGNIEGQWAMQKNELIPLSEQELVDCDKLDQGCNGGLPMQAYREIIRLGGLEGETDYPYEAEDDKCSLRPRDIRVYINDSLEISKNETEMAVWLQQNGPISIGINAGAMMWYRGGIAHPWRLFCAPDYIDHGVLIVGYGVGKTWFGKPNPYWIIKNSWGEGWGESGYYRLYRGAGVCGVNTMTSSAIVR